jgi:zinc transporter 1
LEQWGKTEQYLQLCFEEYGISHVTISPEIQRDTQSEMESEDMIIGCRLPSDDEFGCAVDVKKRKVILESAAPV